MALQDPYDPALALSGLEITQLQAGSLLKVAFTASDTSPFGTLTETTDTITGLWTDANGVVIGKLGDVVLSTGLFGGPRGSIVLGGGKYALIPLQSLLPIPADYAGTTITIVVGPVGVLSAFTVGTTYVPQAKTLTVSRTVPGAPASTPPPPSSPPTTGSPPSTGGGGAAGWWNSLSSTQQILVIAAGSVGVGALAFGIDYAIRHRKPVA